METSLFDSNILIERMRNGIKRLDGSTTILNLIEFPKAVTIEGLDIIIPGTDDFDKGFEISIKLLSVGTPIPAVDIILAAVALNRGMVLITKDKHFKYVQKLYPEFKLQMEKK